MDKAYGMTVGTFSAGVSLVTSIPTGAYVMARDLVAVTGGTLKIAGESVASANMLAVPISTYPLRIPGPTPIYISAGGATMTVSVVTYLSQSALGSSIIP